MQTLHAVFRGYSPFVIVSLIPVKLVPASFHISFAPSFHIVTVGPTPMSESNVDRLI